MMKSKKYYLKSKIIHSFCIILIHTFFYVLNSKWDDVKKNFYIKRYKKVGIKGGSKDDKEIKDIKWFCKKHYAIWNRLIFTLI